ncbi:hypothetical protein L6E12_31415 [Actinokineospora sp. PR83]|uniref:hypothetical protein n=1 Tax=Actinokineospora sp. PR83 TaxID=2884908 RepID=UPI001F2DA074|nr:hypothetical protein [Actinokineospora sp. PR83]MCG8920288.1 hypothetical protein [Actinokineospora sp. PR83]
MTAPAEIRIGGLPLLDYALAKPRDAVKLVKEHKRRYLDPTVPAWAYYRHLYIAMRGAANAPNPRDTIDGVVAWAATKGDWRQAAYRQAGEGYLRLLAASRGTGVKVNTMQWHDGPLTITLNNLIGLRSRGDKLLIVTPYCKAPELDQQSADLLLQIVQEACGGLGTPVLWDTRRGREFKLNARTNRRDLSTAVHGLVAKYLMEWNLAA